MRRRTRVVLWSVVRKRLIFFCRSSDCLRHSSRRCRSCPILFSRSASLPATFSASTSCTHQHGQTRPRGVKPRPIRYRQR
jgi:hypothetical protein